MVGSVKCDSKQCHFMWHTRNISSFPISILCVGPVHAHACGHWHNSKFSISSCKLQVQVVEQPLFMHKPDPARTPWWRSHAPWPALLFFCLCLCVCVCICVCI